MTNDTVQAPTPAQLKELADDLGFDLSEAELAAFGELIGPSIDAYNAVDRMAQELPPVKYPRTSQAIGRAIRRTRTALVRQDDHRGRAGGQAQGQDGRDQGQRVHHRRADNFEDIIMRYN